MWCGVCVSDPQLDQQITKDDYLPKHICELCLGRLEHLYEWRQICMRNEHMLRNYAASMHTVRATIDFQVSAPKYVGSPAAVAAAAAAAATDKRPSRLPWPKLHAHFQHTFRFHIVSLAQQPPPNRTRESAREREYALSATYRVDCGALLYAMLSLPLLPPYSSPGQATQYLSDCRSRCRCRCRCRHRVTFWFLYSLREITNNYSNRD